MRRSCLDRRRNNLTESAQEPEPQLLEQELANYAVSAPNIGRSWCSPLIRRTECSGSPLPVILRRQGVSRKFWQTIAICGACAIRILFCGSVREAAMSNYIVRLSRSALSKQRSPHNCRACVASLTLHIPFSATKETAPVNRYRAHTQACRHSARRDWQMTHPAQTDIFYPLAPPSDARGCCQQSENNREPS